MVKGGHPKKPPTEVSVHVATAHNTYSLMADKLTVHWAGPKILVGLRVRVRRLMLWLTVVVR